MYSSINVENFVSFLLLGCCVFTLKQVKDVMFFSSDRLEAVARDRLPVDPIFSFCETAEGLPG